MGLIVSAYSHLHRIESDRLTKENLTLALLAADAITLLTRSDTPVEIDRYLPFKEPAKPRIPLTPSQCRLVLKALDSGVIPPRLVGLLAPDMEDIARLAEK